MTGSRRLVRVRYPVLRLLPTFVQGTRHLQDATCAAGLPRGARLAGVTLQTGKHPPGDTDLVLIFEHESFAEVPDGKDPPELRIIYHMRGVE
jgi:hypothetical protein